MGQASPRIWLIAGPTASGKSALALRLARAIGGEIINADSMQLYAELRVLTARPSAQDEALAPHHLYGVASAGQAWSAGRWLRAALAEADSIQRRGRSAIYVGGTGLYFNALTHGLADVPPTKAAARAQAAVLLEEEGEAVFRGRLADVDPASESRILPGDRQRLTRALEVFLSTGRPLSAWRRQTKPALAPGSWRGVVLTPPIDALYGRCEARASSMAAGGAIDEVRRLLDLDLSASLPAMKALGVGPLAAHLRGEIDLAAAVERLQTETRRYAKRQMTWFRHQTPDWPRITAETPAEQWDALDSLNRALTSAA